LIVLEEDASTCACNPSEAFTLTFSGLELSSKKIEGASPPRNRSQEVEEEEE